MEAVRLRYAHGLRNELHFQLKELHRLVQCSRFILARDQKYLCLLEAGESGRMLSSQISDELKLVAHPVGSYTLLVKDEFILLYSSISELIQGMMSLYTFLAEKIRICINNNELLFLIRTKSLVFE